MSPDTGKAAASLRRTAAVFLASLAISAFAPPSASGQFTVGQKTLGPHLGLAGVGSTAFVGASGEVAVAPRFGIGAWIDTWSFGQAFGFPSRVFEWQIRYVAIAGTGAYHFPLPSNPRVDPFAGLAVGYYVVSVSTNVATGELYTGDASRVFLGGFAGVRYAFKPNLFGVARVGVGSAYLTVGVDFLL